MFVVPETICGCPALLDKQNITFYHFPKDSDR